MRMAELEIPMELVGNNYEAPIKTLDDVFRLAR
jgi:hypothetical protein